MRDGFRFFPKIQESQREQVEPGAKNTLGAADRRVRKALIGAAVSELQVLCR